VTEWERHALADLREGRIADALAAYSDANRVHVFASPPELRDALVDGYMTARSDGPGDGVVVLATSRREVRQLNREIRSALQRRGLVGAEALTVPLGSATREFAIGDAVMITRNHYAHGVLNGMRGRVVSFDSGDGSLVMADGDGIEHRLDTSLLRSGDVQHAYAMTVHKAQGMTLDVALVSGSATLRKEASYVAMSRGRMSNHVFITDDDLRSNAPDVADLHDAAAALDELQQRLERSGAHRLASSFEPLHPFTHDIHQRESTTRGIER
jgi:ATP-dependent exoDNAse (exonuclease V) alpha subunit